MLSSGRSTKVRSAETQETSRSAGMIAIFWVSVLEASASKVYQTLLLIALTRWIFPSEEPLTSLGPALC
jgi:hypothetical protein